MSFNIKTIQYFDKQAKKLSKKYPSFKDDLAVLIESLTNDPKQGIPMGRNCYKIRMAVKSKDKGKSGGTRVITHIVIVEEKVFLLSVYDKSDKDNISDKEVKELLKYIE